MSRQEEHLNRVIRSIFRLQGLNIELELFPVPGARIEQTEPIRQLEATHGPQSLKHSGKQVLRTAPITFGSALVLSWAKKPGM